MRPTVTSPTTSIPNQRSLDRQTHFVASLMLVASLVLARTVHPAWMALAVLPAFGLMLDAVLGICPMTLLLKRMPWNTGRG